MAAAGRPAAAQPFDFGSADDPFERGSAPGGADGLRAAVFAGPAYLDAWRSAVYAEADARAGRLSAGVAAALHPGAGGLYRDEATGVDDVLRAFYGRLDPTPTSRVYLRAGPTARVSLGAGALVRHYGTLAAPDERPLGAEGAVEIGPLYVAAFTGNVRLDGIIGGEIRVATPRAVGPLRRLRLGLAAVHDLGPPAAGARRLTGAEVTLRGDLVGDGETFAVAPFVTAAGYAHRGHTLGGGLDAEATSLGDAVRARARIAVFGSSSRFVPGHVGPFYRVGAGDARIVDAESFYDAEPVQTAGTPLDSLRAGVDVVVDLRAVVFGRAEVSQYLRRHVGADRASAYGVRLAGRLPGDVRVELAVERQGFRGITGLIFGGLGEENLLVFDIGAPVGPVHVFVRSRYAYRRLGADELPGAGAAPRYLVERRFEPLVGLRFTP